MQASAQFSPHARAAVRALESSQIRAVANAAMGRADVLPFWFGEPDEVTPDFIRAAGIASLNAGETFYSHNFGIPSLREALAAYLSSLHARCAATNIAVTSSGVSALMIAAQALVDPGDRVVCVTPLWPNITEIPRILGAHVVRLGLRFAPDSGWSLDTQQLLDALTPGTKMVIINSPNNPTGWTITLAQQCAVLDHCRKLGIWILADDAYARLFYSPSPKRVAPSFFDLCDYDAGDRVVSASTFSKSWLMTGWRLGWLAGPSAFIADLGALLEYNTSCAPVFVQRAGEVAVREGDAVIARTQARFVVARDYLSQQLNALPGIAAPAAPGAMYAFFKVEGLTDSLALCKRLVAEAGLGLAPGAAFGPEGEGFVRWCFAADEAKLADGIDRFSRFLQAN